MSIQKIGILGTGTIGAGLATLAVGNGMSTTVIGHSQTGLLRCRDAVVENLDQLVREFHITAGNKQAALNLLTITADWRELAGADLVFEAVREDLSVKRETIKRAESYLSPDVPILSCTSTILPSKLAEAAAAPQRIAVAHPFQPAHLLPLIELMGHPKTPPDFLQETASVLRSDLDRQVVILRKETPGLLVNRLSQAMFRECFSLLEKGVTTPEELDRAVHYAIGLRYSEVGLLEGFDDVGFELEEKIAGEIYPSLCNTAEVQAIVRAGILKGQTGREAGKGLYDWSEKNQKEYEWRKAWPFFKEFHWKFPKEAGGISG